MKKKIEVYYDGVCMMCEGSMGAIERSSKGGAFERIDVTKGRLPPGKDMDAALQNMHVVDEAGRVYEGVDGIFRILEEYPHLRWLARLGRVWGIRHIARGMYRIVAMHRRRFNKLLG